MWDFIWPVILLYIYSGIGKCFINIEHIISSNYPSFLYSSCFPGYQKIRIYINFVGDNMMKPGMFLFDDELIWQYMENYVMSFVVNYTLCMLRIYFDKIIHRKEIHDTVIISQDTAYVRIYFIYLLSRLIPQSTYHILSII